MLQLGGNLRNASSRLAPIASWRFPTQQLVASCSGATNASLAAGDKEEATTTPEKQSAKRTNMSKSRNPVVQAVFNSLSSSKFGPEINVAEATKETQFDSELQVHGLLKMTEKKHVTVENAAAVVYLLIDKINSGKATLADFEFDPRFVRLCDILAKKKTGGHKSPAEDRVKRKFDETNIVFGINEIEEASKAVASIDVQDAVKAMSALAHQKRRTTPLLRSLSFNIARKKEPLSVKQMSDLLYSMAVLNYPDEILLQRISNDLLQSLAQFTKSSVVGSILTSLGMLRYKDEELLDLLSEWMIQHKSETRPQDVCSFFMTLAMLGYTPVNAETLCKVLVEPMKESDMVNPAHWLDVVWSFTVLRWAGNEKIASVLDNNFVRKLGEGEQVPVPKQHKLLNINGVARLLSKNYDGPYLQSDSESFKCPFQRSKEKQIFAKSVTSALENIYSSPTFSKLNVDFGLGFVLDAEICVDKDGKPLPVDCNLEETKGTRIAIMSLCFNDFCRGKKTPLGFYDLYTRLLEAKGYQVLIIPHTEFSMEDKILQRIIYINNRIKGMLK